MGKGRFNQRTSSNGIELHTGAADSAALEGAAYTLRRQSRPAFYRVQSVEANVQSVDLKVQSVDAKVQSVEENVQSVEVEVKVQSVDCARFIMTVS